MYYFPWEKEIENKHVFYYNFMNEEHTKNEKLRIVIRFSDDYIRFYWNNIDYEDPLFPENQTIFSIDLSCSKTIGNDILAINQKRILTPKHITINKNSINNFVKEFISEMENDEGVFSSSLIVYKAHVKLNKSITYKLIAAKNNYNAYVSQKIGLDPYEYNRIVSEYVDLLMSPKITSILPPNKTGKDCFLDNPEYELQLIIQKGSSLRWKPSKLRKMIFALYSFTYFIVFIALLFSKFDTLSFFILMPFITSFYLLIECTKKKCKLERNIATKIQNYFLRNHSTISAYYTWTGKIIYCLTWIIMLVWVIFVINGCTRESHSDYYKYLWFSGTSIFILFCINAVFNNHNSLFPRISIALVAAWSLIVLSGDFVFSYLFYRNEIMHDFVLIVISGLIILFILYMECSTFSPYVSIRRIIKKEFWRVRECNWKIIPIFSYSLFLSLFLGIGIQLITFKPLLITRNTLTQVIYSSDFSKIEHHKNDVKLLIDDLESYKKEIIYTQTHNSISDSLIHNNHKKCILYLVDSISKYYNCEKLSLIINDNFLKEKLSVQIDYIDSSLLLLHSRISNLRVFTDNYYNSDSLFSIVTNSISFKGDNAKICSDFLVSTNYNNNDIVCVKLSNNEEHQYLFPRLLILHAFIALLIAFIMQMIISGKTVTEGL